MADLIQHNPLAYQSAGGYPPRNSGYTKVERHEGVREKRVSQRIPAVAVPLEEKQPEENLPTSALVDDEKKVWTRHAEATWVELFYDLFFVANLTTFTDSHQINDSATLQSYIGYFAVLWFTWLQAALFDLRFGGDSLIQRIAKALQIGVMVGFSAINSKFDPRYPEQNWQAFKTLSLLLFASRFAIAIQYFVVWWTVRQYTKTKMPLLLMSILMFISMILFLGLAFSFSATSNTKGYIGWYVVLSLEAVLVLSISLKWKIVGFKGTHLIQRMGLLTLIVMGEGIIGLCRATSLTNEGVGATSWSPTLSGQAISGILCIYFLYMLYFDDEPNYVYSTVPQQLWAILHFPFHLAVILFVEGQQQLMIWQGIITALNILGANLDTAYNDGGKVNGGVIANSVLDVINDFFPEETAKIVASEPAFVFNLAPMRDSGDATFIRDQIDKLWDLCAYAIFSGYHIEAPSSNDQLFNTDKKFDGFSRIYNLVVVYFFVSAGGFLLILALFTYLMKWPKDRYEWLHIAYRTVFGLVIGLIATVATSKKRMDGFVTSPWVVPMMMLLLLGLLLLDKLTILAALKYSDKKLRHHKWLHGQDTRDDAAAESQQDLISTSVSSVTSTSTSSSSSGSNGLPAMPGADNPAPEGSGGGGEEEEIEEGYPAPGSQYSSHPSNRSFRRNGQNYYAASQLSQVEESPDEDAFHDARGFDEEDEENQEEQEGLIPHLPNSSIPSGNPSRAMSPQAHHHQPQIPITERHLQSPAPSHLRNYNEFTARSQTPPLGATYYESHPRSVKSPVTVIRHPIIDSTDSLIPKPLHVVSRRHSNLSSVSNIDKLSTDMPQTHRGFMAEPIGFAEGVEGRVDAGGGGGGGMNRKGVVGTGKFMRSTESMLGMRPAPGL
ncbi:hypothetical protein TWF481_008169 [Arthrobotrys musiformis]|uniref:Low temperature requirement A n=1 Tax=Arthrobotrys musiformis TaxID=47236 RepID=A0AAV9W6C3_9PEZI